MEWEFQHQISVEEYNCLRESVGWERLNASKVKVGLAHSLYLITAVEHGRVIGMARLVGDGGYVFFIVDVMVLPEYQGSGLGKQLVTLVKEFVMESLEPGQKVALNLMSAKGKEEFYRSLGFSLRPNENNGAGMTQYLQKSAECTPIPLKRRFFKRIRRRAESSAV